MTAVKDENVAKQYNVVALEYANNRLGKEEKADLKKFGQLLRPSSKVLDVGCAAGRDTQILSKMGFDATGADIADKLLEIAKSTYPDLNFIHANMRKLPFGASTFDGVWASAVLHHISNDEMPAVLRDFYRVLNNDGVLYIRTKSGRGRLTTHEEIVGKNERSFTLITSNELNIMLVDAGFEKLSIGTQPSKSRPNLTWVSAFYRKPAISVVAPLS